MAAAVWKHGHSVGGKMTPEYRSWAHFIGRCTNPNDKKWSSYGGRGIQVCDRWRNSFANFYADMGPRPAGKTSIDRIDNDGNYEPGNCRWATATEQYYNRRVRSTLIPIGPRLKYGRFVSIGRSFKTA